MFDITTKTSDYMSIVLTHECNRRCPFCIDKYRGREEYIALTQVSMALEFAKNNMIKDILLVGGEPTLHPEIAAIAKMVKDYGFNLILTTNYSKPEVVKALDGIVDSFNISYYNQSNLPDPTEYISDITLSVLLYKDRFASARDLDAFINKFGETFVLKFSTLTVCNDWTREHQSIPFLDDLVFESEIVLFDEIIGQIYKGCLIKRYDNVVNTCAQQSYKCHVDGTINTSWDRKI